MKMVLCVLLIFALNGTALAEYMDAGFETVLEHVDLAPIEKAGDISNLKDSLLLLARGKVIWDAEALLETLKNAVLGELQTSFQHMLALIAPALFCALAGMLNGRDDSIIKLAENTCFLALTAVMASDMKQFLFEAEQAVLRMNEVMQALFPVLLMLLAAVGAVSGAALFQPAIAAASGTMTTLVRTVSLPLCLGMAVVTMLDSLSDTMRLKRLAALLRSVATWTLGIAFTVFIGVTSMQGLTAAAADGVSIRAAKYAVDHFVPVVGGMFADTMDTLVGCSLLIKNALGVTGLMLLFSVAGLPMLRTICAALMYRICAALLQPASQERVATTLHSFSDVLTLLFAIQLSVGAMFLLLVAQVLAVGNITVSLR